MAKNNFVLHLFRNKGILYLADKEKKETLFGFEWDDDEGLGQFLEKIKQRVKSKKIKILLDDNICYFFKLKTTSKKQIDQELVFQKISKEIPEDLELSDWTFKEIQKENDLIELVVFAPVKRFYDDFKTKANDLGLKVNLMAPFKLASEDNQDPIISLVQEEIEEIEEETPIGKPEHKSINESKKTKLVIFVLIFGLLFLAVIGIVLFFYFNSSSGDIKSPIEQVNNESELSESTSSPIPSPVPDVVDRQQIKIKILNGSGVAGLAGQAQAVLEGLGYEDIEVGNADSYDYELGEIRAKQEGFDYASLLKEDLKGEYFFEQENQVLSPTSPYDLVLVISKPEFEEN